MNAAGDPDALRTAQRILDYLRTHADAADTAEGVAMWWLAGGPTLPVEAIEEAMTLLVDQGLAERQVLPDGRVLYRGPRRSTH